MVHERRIYAKEFKLKLMHEILAGATVAELARRHQIHSRLLYRWFTAYQRDPEHAFDAKPMAGRRRMKTDPQAAHIAELERKLGEVTMENELLKKALQRVEATFGPRPRKPGTR